MQRACRENQACNSAQWSKDAGPLRLRAHTESPGRQSSALWTCSRALRPPVRRSRNRSILTDTTTLK
eukprot:4739891-Pyramimonas_sp.AAC.1